MKIHAFRVNDRGRSSLHTVLQYIRDRELPDRLATVHDVRTRLEHCERDGDFWHLDFTIIRRKGPGRASRERPTQDFDLLPGEGFSEETAALYHRPSGFMVVQYNHYGPRESRIQAYLNQFTTQREGRGEVEDAERGFDLTSVIHPETAAELEGLGIVKSFDASFFVPGLRARPRFRSQSLNSVLETSLFGNSRRVRIHLSAGRKKGATLPVAAVRRTVGDLLGAGKDTKALSIIGQVDEDAPSQPIDLLTARLEVDIEVALVGSRYPRNARLAALRTAFDDWREEGQLQ